jgi:hypothetical protein
VGRAPLAHVGFSTPELKDKNTYDQKIINFFTAVKN